jgi:hypothetical protein
MKMTVNISKNSAENSIMKDEWIKCFKSLLNAGNGGLYTACLCQENTENKIGTQFKRDARESQKRDMIWKWKKNVHEKDWEDRNNRLQNI